MFNGCLTEIAKGQSPCYSRLLSYTIFFRSFLLAAKMKTGHSILFSIGLTELLAKQGSKRIVGGKVWDDVSSRSLILFVQQSSSVNPLFRFSRVVIV